MYLQSFIAHFFWHSLSPLNPPLSKCVTWENLTWISGCKTYDNLLHSCLHLTHTAALTLEHMVCFLTALSACLCFTVLCEQQSECTQHSKTRWGLASCCYQCGKQWLINYVCGRHCAHYDSGKLSVTFTDPSRVHREYGCTAKAPVTSCSRKGHSCSLTKIKSGVIISRFCIKIGFMFMALPQLISSISHHVMPIWASLA